MTFSFELNLFSANHILMLRIKKNRRESSQANMLGAAAVRSAIHTILEEIPAE